MANTMMERFLELMARLGRMIREACAAIWQGLRSRYVREVEAEVARLRAENRALLNALLGTAGIPPLQVEPREAGERHVAPAVRRRSWQQLGRMLEIEEARRLRQAQQAAEVEPRSSAPEISGRTKTYTERNGAERNAAKPSPAPYALKARGSTVDIGSGCTGPTKPNGGA